MKKALVINPLNTWWSFQLTLELAYRYKKLDYEVYWLNAAVKNKKKFEMNKSDYINPVFFRTPNKIIKELLNQDGIKGDFNYIKIKNSKGFNAAFKDIEELKAYQYKGSPIGQIIFSGIATKLKHTGFLISEVTSEIHYYSHYLFELEKKLVPLLKKLNPDLVVTINDRLPGSAISLAYSRNLSISTKVYYWGSGIRRMIGYDNSLYDFDEWRCMIRNNLYDKPITKIKKDLVTKEIEQLANSPSKDSKIFLAYQKPGKSIEKKRKMIVFYATSEHEHSPLLAQKHIKFLTQYQAFEVLQALCIENDYQLIFKHHPPEKKIFFKRLNKQRIHDWKKVKFDKETIQLMPDSAVDTYQLIQDADINVTWGSTVGIESIAREKPTIIMGDQTWLNKGWGIHAWDVETLEILLKSNSYELKKEVLIPWFWFMQDYGESFEFVKTENYNPSVRGVKVLQPRWPFVPLYKIAVKLKTINMI